MPLIQALPSDKATSVWYADDAGAGGELLGIKQWWDSRPAIEPSFGYNPNASTSWLLVKEIYLDTATVRFEGTGINVTTDGRPYLESPIGSPDFFKKHIGNKFDEWCAAVEVPHMLCHIRRRHMQCSPLSCKISGRT